MLILADTTEERFLPDSVKSSCQFVSGLEDLTGADFILSPLPIPYKTEDLLLRHARLGLCVQRKDIGDFAASIRSDDNRLWSQLLRLKEITNFPWLLIIGDLKCTKEGKAVIDGRDTEVNYYSIISAMSFWQLRRGYMTWLSRDGNLEEWCRIWYERLASVNRRGTNGWGEFGFSRPVAQGLYEASQIERTLGTFPGLGTEKAHAIYNFAKEKCEGEPTLMDVMLTIQDDKVEGVGKKSRDKIMRYIGWETE